MSLSFNLLSEQRAARERERRWREARRSLLGWALACLLLAATCGVFAYVLTGFFHP